MKMDEYDIYQIHDAHSMNYSALHLVGEEKINNKDVNATYQYGIRGGREIWDCGRVTGRVWNFKWKTTSAMFFL